MRVGRSFFVYSICVMLLLSQAKAQSVDIQGELAQTLEEYRRDTALLLDMIFKMRAVSPESDVQMLMDEIATYVKRTKNFIENPDNTQIFDDRVRSPAAQIYAYYGVALGRSPQKIPDAIRQFDQARNLFPTVGTSDSPLQNTVPGDNLGTLMAYSEKWKTQVGRVNVYAAAQWMVDTLRYSPLGLKPSQSDSVFFSFEEENGKIVYDSLIELSTSMLNDSIRASVSEFNFLLPRGHYTVLNPDSLSVPVNITVTDSVDLNIVPRVDLWLPEVTALTDTIRLMKVLGDSSSLGEISSDRIAFGQEYELLISTAKYKRFEATVFFHRTTFPASSKNDVISIPAEPGEQCLYFKKGTGKLQSIKIYDYYKIPLLIGSFGLLIFML